MCERHVYLRKPIYNGQVEEIVKDSGKTAERQRKIAWHRQEIQFPKSVWSLIQHHNHENELHSSFTPENKGENRDETCYPFIYKSSFSISFGS